MTVIGWNGAMAAETDRRNPIATVTIEQQAGALARDFIARILLILLKFHYWS